MTDAAKKLVESLDIQTARLRSLVMEFDTRTMAVPGHIDIKDLEHVGLRLTTLLEAKLKVLPVLLEKFRSASFEFVWLLEYFTQRVIAYFGQPDIKELGDLPVFRERLKELQAQVRALLPDGAWYEPDSD